MLGVTRCLFATTSDDWIVSLASCYSLQPLYVANYWAVVCSKGGIVCFVFFMINVFCFYHLLWLHTRQHPSHTDVDVCACTSHFVGWMLESPASRRKQIAHPRRPGMCLRTATSVHENLKGRVEAAQKLCSSYIKRVRIMLRQEISPRCLSLRHLLILTSDLVF